MINTNCSPKAVTVRSRRIHQSRTGDPAIVEAKNANRAACYLNPDAASAGNHFVRQLIRPPHFSRFVPWRHHCGDDPGE
jgi:hypothetical protein